MSTIIKQVSVNSTIKRHTKEVITPHRLCVAILILEFCKFRENESFQTSSEYKKKLAAKHFCILILKLIQNPDMPLENLIRTISTVQFDNSIPLEVFNRFEEEIVSINEIGVRQLLDTVDAIGDLMNSVDNALLKCGSINKNSVVGYFFRRLVITFEELTFSEVITFLAMFKDYSASVIKDRNEMNSSKVHLVAKLSNKKTNTMECFTDKHQWTRRQAELFIATQAALLTNNEQEALNPKDLNKHITNLLQSHPDLSETHFLNYLNYLRVKEFCGAIESLYHCFDKSASVDKATADEKPKSYRYAALNLAVLHYQFGHKEEALASLKEAIKLAQEANDTICLQHALSWLYCLTNFNKDKLIEHSILKSIDLNLSYIMSLGIQSFCMYAGVTSGNPKQTFETITKSDIINCQHTHRDLISSSYAQKSSLWCFYGKTEMCALWSQLLLYLNTDSVSSSSSPGNTFYGEGYCQALCNVAGQLHDQGCYGLTVSIIGLLKERFPSEPVSHIWMLSENIFSFTHMLRLEQFEEAEIHVQKIAVINKWESYLRMAELLLHKRDYTSALDCVNKILSKCKDGTRMFRMDVQVRAMLLLADIQIATSFPDTVPPGILGLLNSSLAYAQDFHLNYLAALAYLRIAHVQLLLGLVTQALHILDRCLVQVLAHGSCYDRACAMLLHVKCTVAAATRDSHHVAERDKVLYEATQQLQDVRLAFEGMEAYCRAKDVLFLQAQLFNEIHMYEERNKAALYYRLLDDNYPTTNTNSMLTFL